ncbi:hypothetical protein [uncultured Intestinimonas sp.]|uniref:hypothetical protein n=1 Tax=uncultured Intestinimonas sp. TaxID=1689265 RepID=UPI0025D424AF|nr:hypothetical protein [uncultured Intestinimonas sp.]
MTEYHFRADLAGLYGVDGAIFLHCMAFWTAKNRANERHYHEGRYWTYNTLKALTQLFPFWSRRQLERIIGRLKEAGALLSGNFSEDKTDRTLWYALGDSVLEAYGEALPSISRNGEMDFTEQGQPCHETVKCNKETVTYQIDTPYSPPEKKPGKKAELPQESKALLEEYVQDKPPELANELRNFVAARMEEKKAKHSITAYRAILNRLDRFSGGDDGVKMDMLSLAASRNWITVYPPKDQPRPREPTQEDDWNVE